MRIELHFTYTVDDLREATAPVTEDPTKRRAAAAPRKYVMGRGLIGWMLFVGLAVGLFVLLQRGQDAGVRRAGGIVTQVAYERLPPVQDLSVLLASSLAPALIIALFVLLMAIALARAVRRPMAGSVQATARTSKVIGAIIGVAVFAVSMATMWLVGSSSATMPWRPTRMTAMAVGLAPWVVLFIFVWAIFAYARRRGVDRTFENVPGWRRPKVLVIDDDHGWSIADDTTSYLYRWPYFVSARETERLLMLHDEENRIHILPKRASADHVEIARARAMIQNHVAETKFFPQSGAFPVLPMHAQPTPFPPPPPAT
jgi:hypothetical protein